MGGGAVEARWSVRRAGRDPRLLPRWTASGGELAHDGVERRLPLEPDAGRFRQREITAVQLGVIGKAAEGAEYARIGFRASQPETSSNGERHLVTAGRKQCAARAAVALEHRDGTGVLQDAVGMWRVDLDDVVALRTQSAEAHQVFHVLRDRKSTRLNSSHTVISYA